MFGLVFTTLEVYLAWVYRARIARCSNRGHSVSCIRPREIAAPAEAVFHLAVGEGRE